MLKTNLDKACCSRLVGWDRCRTVYRDGTYEPVVNDDADAPNENGHTNDSVPGW